MKGGAPTSDANVRRASRADPRPVRMIVMTNEAHTTHNTSTSHRTATHVRVDHRRDSTEDQANGGNRLGRRGASAARGGTRGAGGST